MRDSKQKTEAKRFAEYWKDKGYEKGEGQPFWLALLRDVLGVEKPEQLITFEEQVRLDHTSFIDGFIPATHVLIEQKGRHKDLRKPIKQSDGTLLTPFQQAQRYSAALPYSQRPRWIVASNFEEILVYDMERPNGEPEQIFVKDLEKEYYRLMFLVDTGDENIKREMEISIQAGNVVGALYDEMLKQYIDPTNPESLKSLNQLCVRLVFCLYAEDAGIFGGHNKFHNYIQSYPAEDMREALIKLFKVLDTKFEERDPYMKADLSDFPYVNGGLFADENIEIPQFNEKIKEMLLTKASTDFDWSDISPTIFGAVFESTLNPETRRSGGMHYTSIENIHKVIDPLFLDELREELESIKETKVGKIRENKLNSYIEKLSQLIFLDPACGSGNFLTETYISLRRLENEALKLIHGDNIVMAVKSPIQVSIGQFCGIEINDFAVTVAKTALWIAESQMMKETEEILHTNLEFLPLKSYANIVEGNALRIDWNEVVPKEKLNYIMGNPPFVGFTYQTKEQKEDLQAAIGNTAKTIDYVTGWYFKAAEIMANENGRQIAAPTINNPTINNQIVGADIIRPNIKTAFVSTNSICQGEQVSLLWKPLFEMGVEIDFAHRSFIWDSEASVKAHVHCVIVGFGRGGYYPPEKPKYIYTDDRPIKANNINGYLLDADNVFIEKRSSPMHNVPLLINGGKPAEGGFLILTEEEKTDLLLKEPQTEKFIRPFMMGKDFIRRKPRYCLWLVGANPSELKQCRRVMERVEKVREFRLTSKKAATRAKADTPTLFDEIKECNTDYIAIPKVSSENRRYIPIDYLSANIIAGDKLFMLPDATLYHFGVLTSNVHMAWTRAVCGRLEMRYSYSNTIVYNNFPWCNPTDEQKNKIEKTAQSILDARAKYPNSSLADLYDELTMPPELRKAHQENDKAVMKAYGFDVKTMTESSCVAELMKMHQLLCKGDE